MVIFSYFLTFITDIDYYYQTTAFVAAPIPIHLRGEKVSILSHDEPELQTELITIDVIRTTASLPGTRKRPGSVLVLRIPQCPRTKESFGTYTGTASFLETLGVIEKAVCINPDAVAVWPNPRVELDAEIEEAIIKHVAACRQIPCDGYASRFPHKNTKLAKALIADLGHARKRKR